MKCKNQILNLFSKAKIPQIEYWDVATEMGYSSPFQK